MDVDSSQSSNVQPLPRYRNEPKIKSSSGMTVSQLHHNPSTKETSQLPLHLDKRCGTIHKAYEIGGKISFEISCNQRWDKKHTRGTKQNQSEISLLNPHLLFAGLVLETTNNVSLMEEPDRRHYRDPTAFFIGDTSPHRQLHLHHHMQNNSTKTCYRNALCVEYSAWGRCIGVIGRLGSLVLGE